MSYARLASITAWLLVAMFVLGCVAGLLLELELGLGPARDVWTVDSYQRLFIVHSVPMVNGVVRPGLLATVLLAHAARQNPERNIGSWIASVGVVALLTAVGLGLVGSSGLLDDQLVYEIVLWMNRSAAIGDIGIGLGVLLGLVRRERAPIDGSLELLAAAMLVIGSIDLLAIGAPTMVTIRMVTTLGLALVIVFAANSRRHARARVAAAMLTAAAILDVVTHAWFTGSWFFALDQLRSVLAVIGMLFGVIVMLDNPNDGPAKPAVRAAGLLLVALAVLRRYLDAISIDVHIADSYLALADVHLNALFVVGLGGPLMLRRSFADRYEHQSSVWVQAMPWAIAGALLAFAGALALLGREGMPRRYYAYLPEYLSGHVVAAVAAVILVAALVGEALLWIRGRPSSWPGSA